MQLFLRILSVLLYVTECLQTNIFVGFLSENM